MGPVLARAARVAASARRRLAGLASGPSLVPGLTLVSGLTLALAVGLAVGLALAPESRAGEPPRHAEGQPPAAVPDTMAQRALACTGCHGPQGQSRPDGYVPRLAGKPAGYLFAQLQAYRDGRRQHRPMARLLEYLDDDMLQALAGHFATLHLPYPAPVSRGPTGADARRAEELVRRGDPGAGVPACAACHGEALTGVAPGVPGLVGLPPDYLLAQIGAWREELRHARDPDCMARIARRLPAADVARVARWLAAQPVPADSMPVAEPPGEWPMDCAGVAR